MIFRKLAEPKVYKLGGREHKQTREEENCFRWSSWDDALTNHRAIVKRLRARYTRQRKVIEALKTIEARNKDSKT